MMHQNLSYRVILGIVGMILLTRPTVQLQTAKFPHEVIVEVKGLQTFAGKMVREDTLELLGQTWKAEIREGHPFVNINGVQFKVESPDARHLTLTPPGNNLPPKKHDDFVPPPPQELELVGRTPAKFLEDLGIETVQLPGGTFLMGSPSQENGRDEDEISHSVSLSPFRVMKSHLTRLQWEKMMKRGPFFPSVATVREKQTWESCPQCPMAFISWYEVRDLIQILRKTGIPARFLTEAETEYLARLQPYSQPQDLTHYSWFNENSGGQPQPVNTRKAIHPYLISDVMGNVFTWTADKYSQYSLNELNSNNPIQLDGPEDQPRVVRGGGWGSGREILRPAFRSFWRPNDSSHLIGIRLAFEIN